METVSGIASVGLCYTSSLRCTAQWPARSQCTGELCSAVCYRHTLWSTRTRTPHSVVSASCRLAVQLLAVPLVAYVVLG